MQGRHQLCWYVMSGYEPVAVEDTASTPSTALASDDREDTGLLKGTKGTTGPNASAAVGSWRWIKAVVACLMWLCTYADRTNMSLSIVEMEREFGWSASVDGLVLSSFFAGYSTTQVLGGWLAARWNGYAVMGGAVLAYSTATLLTPIAARHSINFLLVTRVLLGIGEGLALPALHHVTARWAPTHERSRFMTISVSGQYLGSTATLLCAPMVHAWWPSIFYLFGGLGIMWVAAWSVIGADSAAAHRYIGVAEREYVTASIPALPRVEFVPWRHVVTEPCALAIYTAHFCDNYANFFIISWLPKYLVDVVGLSLEESGIVLLLPYIMPFFGVLSAGQVSDWLITTRGWNVVTVRKVMQATSDVVLSVCILYFALVPAPTAQEFTVVMAIGGFFKSVHICGYWTNIIDIGPRYAGPLMGVSNTIAALPGVIGNLVTGYVLDSTGSWQVVFLIPCGLLLFGSTVFMCYAKAVVVFR